ncbi:hydroxymethylpyrimidine pyrophosphatase-like HAD family hydrolase [Streptomyces sp. MJP52]|nr:hydroxymethylpyrimidine pyrophosphatase-like HAD family hydrolase [Streptomyces sp. MJP52]
MPAPAAYAPPSRALPAYALIATDLDGTLLRDDDTVSPRTRAALGCAARAGARHLVVTGRPAPRVRDLLAGIGGGFAVCGQGAQLYDADRDRLVWSMTLDRELAETALGKIEAEVGQVYAAVDQDGVDGLTLIEPGYRMARPTLPSVRVDRRDDLWERPITKVLLGHPELTDDELTAVAGAAAGSLATVTMSGPGTVELSSRTASPRRPAWPWRPPGSASARRTPSPSATCRTTCPCSGGRPAGWPWPTPTPS